MAESLIEMPGPAMTPLPFDALPMAAMASDVGCEIALGILHGAGRFAQHVVGIAIAALLGGFGAVGRFARYRGP